MALIVCRAVGMLLGLCSRSGSVLGLTLRREMLCKSEGGTLAPLCDSAVLCSLPPGWGGVGTARSLLLYVKVMQKSQTTLCLAWLQGTVLLFGKEILVNVLLFFFFVISDISPDGCIKVFQVYEDSPELKLRNMSSCPTIEKAFFISCTINAILWLALANKMCLTWL